MIAPFSTEMQFALPPPPLLNDPALPSRNPLALFFTEGKRNQFSSSHYLERTSFTLLFIIAQGPYFSFISLDLRRALALFPRTEDLCGSYLTMITVACRCIIFFCKRLARPLSGISFPLQMTHNTFFFTRTPPQPFFEPKRQPDLSPSLTEGTVPLFSRRASPGFTEMPL